MSEALTKRKLAVREITFIGVITAMICVVAPFSIPIGTVPVALANFVIMLGIYVLGIRDSLISCVLYLTLGAIGLPVFSGGSGGFAKLVGPTGGYLIGYLAFIGVAGLFICRLSKGNRFLDFLGLVLGTAVLYLFGTAWLAIEAKLTFSQALLAGVVPFIPFDLAKTALAVFVGPLLRKGTERIKSGR